MRALLGLLLTQADPAAIVCEPFRLGATYGALYRCGAILRISDSIHPSTSDESSSGVFPARIDRWTDRHRHRPGRFDESTLRPELAGVDGDRHGHCTGAHRKACAPGLVALAGPGLGARTFGKDDDPPAALQTILTLFDDLLECLLTLAAIDADHLCRCNAPTKKRNPVQLTLVNERHLAWHRALQPERLPCRLMLRQQDRRAVRQVVPAFDLAVDPANHARAPDRHAGPARTQPVPRAQRKKPAAKDNERPRRDRDEQVKQVRRRPQPEHRTMR